MIYLYAITDGAIVNLPQVLGLDEAVLGTVSHKDIGAVTSVFTNGEIAATEANLWRHEEVVEAVMAECTVLPVRFGALFANEAELQSSLAGRYDDLTADLKRARGHSELGVRVLWDDDGETVTSEPRLILSCRPYSEAVRDAPSGAGHAYMQTRIEEERGQEVRTRRAKVLASDIHAPLACLAEQNSMRLLLTPRLLLTAAYLVRNDRVSAFRQEVEAISDAHPELRLLCTGPWPPYSFVSGPSPDIPREE